MTFLLMLSHGVYLDSNRPYVHTYVRTPPRRVKKIARAVAKAASMWTLPFPQPSGVRGSRSKSTPNAATAGIFVGDAILDFFKSILEKCNILQ